MMVELFRNVAVYLRAYRYLIRKKSSFLHTSGWIRSLREGKPVDVDGNPIPWMNYPAVTLLQQRLNQDLTLFEFGSGQSTLFFAPLVKHVTSIEYDPSWYEQVQAGMPDNVDLKLINNDVDGEYCRSVLASGAKYDVVIVDGRDRTNCMKQSVHAVTERGVIVLDDSERGSYREGIEAVLAKGFRVLPLDGHKPTVNFVSQTSMFYRDNNCLGV